MYVMIVMHTEYYNKQFYCALKYVIVICNALLKAFCLLKDYRNPF